MRDGTTRHRAEHGQRVAVVTAAELVADRTADDAAGGRRANHTKGRRGLANDFVPALLARAIDRDVAHQRLHADDAGRDDGRRVTDDDRHVLVVPVRVTAAAAAIIVVGQRGARADDPQYGNSEKFVRQHGCSPFPCGPYVGPWSAG
jgi:hypothetical protein